MSGYFSIADCGTYGHWDFSDEKGRFATLRGDDESGWQLCMERRSVRHPMYLIPFGTPFEAVEFVTRHVMPDKAGPPPHDLAGHQHGATGDEQ